MAVKHAARQRGRASRIAAGCALVLPSLVLGTDIPTVAADDLPTAQMDNLRLDGTTAFVTFTDYTEGETGYYITVFERDNRDRTVVDQAKVPAVPGTRRQATRQVTVPEGVALCAFVRSFRFGVDAPLGPIAPQVDNASAAASNHVCADPAFARSDLALENIRGNATPRAGPAAYLVVLRNSGGTNAIGVSVSIATSGSAILGDQAAVAGSWSANGFGCATRPPAGGETSAMTCTGGQLKQGEQINPGMMLQLTPGPGAVHAQISSATTDTNSGNNGTAFTFNVE